jgi:hypothetical protein
MRISVVFYVILVKSGYLFTCSVAWYLNGSRGESMREAIAV